MSELTNITITKIAKSGLLMKVATFRDDSLPNVNLKDVDKIRRTAFTLFVNTISEDENNCKILKEDLKAKLSSAITGIYFKTTTVNRFLKEVKIISASDNISFETSQLALNKEQLMQLYTYMKYTEDEVDIEDDFYVSLFSSGDRGKRVRQIIGDANYLLIEPRLEFEIEFLNPNYLNDFRDIESDSAYDTYISEWLPAENGIANKTQI